MSIICKVDRIALQSDMHQSTQIVEVRGEAVRQALRLVPPLPHEEQGPADHADQDLSGPAEEHQQTALPWEVQSSNSMSSMQEGALWYSLSVSRCVRDRVRLSYHVLDLVQQQCLVLVSLLERFQAYAQGQIRIDLD